MTWCIGLKHKTISYGSIHETASRKPSAEMTIRKQPVVTVVSLLCRTTKTLLGLSSSRETRSQDKISVRFFHIDSRKEEILMRYEVSDIIWVALLTSTESLIFFITYCTILQGQSSAVIDFYTQRWTPSISYAIEFEKCNTVADCVNLHSRRELPLILLVRFSRSITASSESWMCLNLTRNRTGHVWHRDWCRMGLVVFYIS